MSRGVERGKENAQETRRASVGGVGRGVMSKPGWVGRQGWPHRTSDAGRSSTDLKREDGGI